MKKADLWIDRHCIVGDVDKGFTALLLNTWDVRYTRDLPAGQSVCG